MDGEEEEEAPPVEEVGLVVVDEEEVVDLVSVLLPGKVHHMVPRVNTDLDDSVIYTPRLLCPFFSYPAGHASFCLFLQTLSDSSKNWQRLLHLFSDRSTLGR